MAEKPKVVPIADLNKRDIRDVVQLVNELDINKVHRITVLFEDDERILHIENANVSVHDFCGMVEVAKQHLYHQAMEEE